MAESKESSPIEGPKVTSSIEESKVNGLTTPALADGEFTDAKSEFHTEKPQQSALDIATNIETKLKTLFDQVQKDNAEVDQRLNKLTQMVEELRKNMS